LRRKQSPSGTPFVDQNFDTYSVEYTFADGAKMLFDGRPMGGCLPIYSSYVHGSKGMAIAAKNGDCGTPSSIFKGQNPARSNLLWESKDGSSPYQNEWDDLIDAIRNDRPYNEVKRGAEASLVTTMLDSQPAKSVIDRPTASPLFPMSVGGFEERDDVSVGYSVVQPQNGERKPFERLAGLDEGLDVPGDALRGRLAHLDRAVADIQVRVGKKAAHRHDVRTPTHFQKLQSMHLPVFRRQAGQVQATMVDAEGRESVSQGLVEFEQEFAVSAGRDHRGAAIAGDEQRRVDLLDDVGDGYGTGPRALPDETDNLGHGVGYHPQQAAGGPGILEE